MLLNDSLVVLDGQKFLIDICEAEHVDRFFADTYTSELSRLQIGQHERLDLALKIVKYLETKKIRPVHMLIGAFIETWLGYSGTVDLSTNTVSYWGEGNEIWDLTTYDDAAAYTAEAVMDRTAEGFLRCKCIFSSCNGYSFLRLIHHSCGRSDDRPSICGCIREDPADKSKAGSPRHERRIVREDVSRESKVSERQPVDISAVVSISISSTIIITDSRVIRFYTYYTMTGAFRLFDPLDNSRYPDIKPTTVEEFLRIQDLSNPQNTQRPS